MSKSKANGNLQFAFLFFLLLGGIIFISFLLRAFFLISETKFDGNSHFTLEINEKKYVQYLSFSPQASSVGILTFNNTPVPYGIPIDARTNSDIKINSQNLKLTLFKMFFDFKNQKEINFIDIFRLMLFTGTLKEISISEIEVSGITDSAKIDNLISSFFVDSQIQEEKLNIEVINSTEVSGLGNKVANLVSNTGANVVLVSTGEPKKESVIEYFETSYTVDKLEKILKFKKFKVDKRGLADVKIVIGEDYVR